MESHKRVVGLGMLTAASCAFLVSAQALAVDVRGSVKGGESRAKIAETVRTPYWHEWNGFIEPKKSSTDLAREVVVVLIGNDGMKENASLSLQDGTLAQATVVVQKGGTLRIRNEDDFTHQLYAEGLKQFDPIETSAGQSRQVQVDEEGSFPILDKLAPHVRGHLHVLPKVSRIAQPQSDGTFKFPDVAPGSYTLKVFRGASEVSSVTLDVPDKRELVVDPISVDVKGK